jgi:hypothetical protein
MRKKSTVLIVVLLGLLGSSQIQVYEWRTAEHTNCETIREGRQSSAIRNEIVTHDQKFILSLKPKTTAQQQDQVFLRAHKVTTLTPPKC